MVAFDKQRVQSVIKPNEDGVWQSLLDICYNDWQNEKWSLEEMLQNARFSYGEIVELACMLGKYNQQVCNGGHGQYLDNGYSGSHNESAVFGSLDYYDYDVPIAQRLLELLDKYKLSDTDYGKKVHDIVQDFINRTVNWDPDSSNWEEEELDPMPDYDDLDTAYYQVREWWEHELNRYFSLWMEYGEDPIATGRF